MRRCSWNGGGVGVVNREVKPQDETKGTVRALVTSQPGASLEYAASRVPALIEARLVEHPNGCGSWPKTDQRLKEPLE